MALSEKVEAENIIRHLPDDISFEDIQYHLYVAEKLRHARQQIQDGNVHTQADVEKRLAKWIIG